MLLIPGTRQRCPDMSAPRDGNRKPASLHVVQRARFADLLNRNLVLRIGREVGQAQLLCVGVEVAVEPTITL